MIDPLEQALAFIDRARDERAALQRRAETLRVESDQYRRQLERARETITRLEETQARLEHDLDVERLRVEQAERATREHVART